MTAASGILHEERHSAGFSKTGGTFRMVQLWVYLPAKDKMTARRYQIDRRTPRSRLALAEHAGTARVIAGGSGTRMGPAHTFTPINLWDVRLDPTPT